MKTAISISDAQFEAAEKLANRLGVSRSELYQRALAEFITKHSNEAVTEKLNEIYRGDEGLEGIDAELVDLQAQSIPKEKW
ncbi:MAG: hypothetical protein ACRED0_09065 [Gammaproteobacteria bacterium]